VGIECFKEETYDNVNQILSTKMTHLVTEGGMIQRFEGYDQARIFYPQETLFYLASMAGFKVLGLHECWNLERPPVGPCPVVVAERI